MTPRVMDDSTRFRELSNADSEKFWEALRLSLSETGDEYQGKVNDLRVNGDELDRARATLAFINRLVSGEYIRDQMAILATRAKLEE